MPIEGPLKELQIHDVFQLLDLGRKTGVLRVTSELRQNAGVVYFASGGVIAAEIRSNPHPLGALLIRGGKVREEEVARAVAIQRSRPGHRLGDILVEMGALPRKELERQIRVQVEEVIFELMSWSEGYFSFEDGPLPEALGEATVRIPTESLLMEAARRIDEWSRIEAKVPHLGVVPRFIGSPDDEGTQLDLLPFEWEVLAGIDGATDVRSLAGRLGRSDFDVARTLFGLAAAGIIAMSEPAGIGQDAEATVQDLAVLVAASTLFVRALRKTNLRSGAHIEMTGLFCGLLAVAGDLVVSRCSMKVSTCAFSIAATSTTPASARCSPSWPAAAA